MPSVRSSLKLAGAIDRQLTAWYESTPDDPYRARLQVDGVDLLQYDNQALEIWVQLKATLPNSRVQCWRVGLPYGPGDDEWVRHPVDPRQTKEAAFMIAVGLDEWWNTRQGARAWRTDQ